MSARILFICWALLAVFIAGCVTTSTGRNPRVDSGAVVLEGEGFKASIVFSDSDRAKIRRYYKSSHKAKKLPPGLAKKNTSHPGLRNHIRKNRQLPPDISGERLPLNLERTLSRLPHDYVRLRVGGDILLVHEKTRYVLDVVFDLD